MFKDQKVQLQKSSIVRTFDVSSTSTELKDGAKGTIRFNGKVLVLEYNAEKQQWMHVSGRI